MDFTYLIRIGAVTTSPLELIAVAFGLVSVWSMKKESILAFPFGILNLLGYVYLCFVKELYALACINVFMSLMSVYGWINWSRQKEDNHVVKISWCSRKELLLYLAVFVVSFFILRILLKKFTDSPVPAWDAVTTAFYIVAMWLLAIKKIENWFAWILGDLISVVLFAIPFSNTQINYFSSFQFLVFTVIAVFGFLEWKGKTTQRTHA